LSRSKTTTLIALFLLLAMTISLIALPNANAQNRVKTYPYLGVVPNPIGVNQGVIFHVGITKELYSSEMGWEDLEIRITGPVSETLEVAKTDATGGTGVNWVPTVAGNYTCIGYFPEQTTSATKIAGGFFTAQLATGTIMLESESEPVTLVVQEDPIEYYPYFPLPAEYWTRPVDSQQRTWIAVAGNWLEGTPVNYLAEGNEYAPETAHILWAKMQTVGGLAGAPREDAQPFEHGDAYEGKFASRFILGGRLIYNIFAGPSAGVVDVYREYKCIDLHTGEELWSKVFLDNLTISFCQMMFWQTYDYQGVYDYLWASANQPNAYGAGTPGTHKLLGLDNPNGVNYTNAGTTYCAFDSWTGAFVYAMYSIPSGTRVMSTKGEWLIYNIDLTRGYMLMWNSSNIPSLYSSPVYASMGWGQWRPYGKVINATGPAGVTYGPGLFFPPPFIAPTTPLDLAGYQWNKTIESGPNSLPVAPPGQTTIYRVWEGDRIIGSQLSNTAVRMWAINLNATEANIGKVLFNNTWAADDFWVKDNVTVTGAAAGWMSFSQESMVGVLWLRESRQHYGFSLTDGKYMWGPSESQYYLDSIEDVVADVRAIAYDKFYCASVSGFVYCYDVKTGDRLWTYAAEDPYSEIFWSNNWWMKLVMITDGKVYVGTTEHSANAPMPRGGPFICLNATTGEVIWRVNGLFRQTRWGGKGLIGDSIIATQDTYDSRIYAIGKGPSATTVSAGPEGTVEGSSVIVKGMVTDISPGTEEYGLRARFPNGVPAVADENQSDWMLYVYKQFPRPTDIVGVEVVLTVMDPNNNPYEVGRATSDANGFYSLAFTPPVPGKYTIYATFAGSEAYYGSTAETAITVDSAPAETPPPPATPAPMTDTYVTGFGIGIIIAIIVVGLLLFLLLKRR
jgi:outer membrane protein assembly factor BamB